MVAKRCASCAGARHLRAALPASTCSRHVSLPTKHDCPLLFPQILQGIAGPVAPAATGTYGEGYETRGATGEVPMAVEQVGGRAVGERWVGGWVVGWCG